MEIQTGQFGIHSHLLVLTLGHEIKAFFNSFLLVSKKVLDLAGNVRISVRSMDFIQAGLFDNTHFLHLVLTLGLGVTVFFNPFLMAICVVLDRQSPDRCVRFAMRAPCRQFQQARLFRDFQLDNNLKNY